MRKIIPAMFLACLMLLSVGVIPYTQAKIEIKSQEKGGIFQLWDITPAILDIVPTRTYSGNINREGQPGHLFLYEKNPTNWEIVEDGAWGRLVYFGEDNPNNEFSFSGYGLEPETSYTLIRYTDPWGTESLCLGESETESNGNIAIKGELLDGGPKVWLVMSEDVNCGTKMMTAWNPTEYLFENNPI